ncbi:hypothetical protein BG011_009644 [Mortierella polycephala]|uniref:Uncharacterized protein n=1 Tax=Mortierella polycephala TaxID=41804 RepID=A0A9P6Q892_9FUNG|nr:hypothetical protein BG011_009644 [Mortierella polycephala]
MDPGYSAPVSGAGTAPQVNDHSTYVYPTQACHNDVDNNNVLDNNNVSGSSSQQAPYHNNGLYGMTEQQTPLSHDRYREDNEDSSLSLRLEAQQDLMSTGTTGAALQNVTPPGKILVLQILTTLSTIVFTVAPVVIKSGKDESWGDWYTWRDAVRLIEPFCSGILHSWLFYASDLMRPHWENNDSIQRQRIESWNLEEDNGQTYSEDKGHRHTDINRYNTGGPDVAATATTMTTAAAVPGRSTTRSFKHSTWFKSTLAAVFTFFLILYVTGAAIHTAAALFKNTISLFLDQYSQGIGLSTHPLTNGDGQLPMALAQQLKEGYVLIHGAWEHTISHYMYALGALGMSWCEMVAYSGQILPKGVNLARVGHLKKRSSSLSNQNGAAVVAGAQVKTSRRLILLWIIAGVLYGCIVAGVSCQYPKGLYVGLGYIGLLILVLSAYILSTPTRGLFSLGRHYILQTYVIGGVVAFVIIFIYMAVNGFDMLTSNDKSHLQTVNRP